MNPRLRTALECVAVLVAAWVILVALVWLADGDNPVAWFMDGAG